MTLEHAKKKDDVGPMKNDITNHERFRLAFSDMQGRTVSTQEIIHILSKKFPEMARGSMLPNDHAGGNKHPCWCARKDERIFDRVKLGMYKIR